MVRPLDESQGPSPLQGHGSWLMCEVALRDHDEARARDHCTSSTLIDGKDAVGPSSLGTMLEVPMEYVNTRWV